MQLCASLRCSVDPLLHFCIPPLVSGFALPWHRRGCVGRKGTKNAALCWPQMFSRPSAAFLYLSPSQSVRAAIATPGPRGEQGYKKCSSVPASDVQ